MEVERLPRTDRRAKVRGKRERIARILRTHRIARHHERIERLDVLVGNLGEVIVWKGRIQLAPTAVDALVHRASELRLGPLADAGVDVGRDVRRVDDAKRRRQRSPSGVGLTAFRRVAGRAVADRRQVRAFGDQRGVERRTVEREGGGQGQRHNDDANEHHRG